MHSIAAVMLLAGLIGVSNAQGQYESYNPGGYEDSTPKVSTPENSDPGPPDQLVVAFEVADCGIGQPTGNVNDDVPGMQYDALHTATQGNTFTTMCNGDSDCKFETSTWQSVLVNNGKTFGAKQQIACYFELGSWVSNSTMFFTNTTTSPQVDVALTLLGTSSGSTNSTAWAPWAAQNNQTLRDANECFNFAPGYSINSWTALHCQGNSLGWSNGVPQKRR